MFCLFVLNRLDRFESHRSTLGSLLGFFLLVCLVEFRLVLLTLIIHVVEQPDVGVESK